MIFISHYTIVHVAQITVHFSNIFSSNKSDSHSAALTIEKPADFTPANQRKGQSSTETRTNAECDKSSKLTPTSSEWVKNVPSNTRSSIENETGGKKLSIKLGNLMKNTRPKS